MEAKILYRFAETKCTLVKLKKQLHHSINTALNDKMGVIEEYIHIIKCKDAKKCEDVTGKKYIVYCTQKEYVSNTPTLFHMVVKEGISKM